LDYGKEFLGNLLFCELAYEGARRSGKGRNCLQDIISNMLIRDGFAVEYYCLLILLPKLLCGIPIGLVAVLTLQP
jgi:hypothetical protein